MLHRVMNGFLGNAEDMKSNIGIGDANRARDR